MARFKVSRRTFVIGASSLGLIPVRPSWAAGTEPIDPQPYFASVKRVIEALAVAGQPIAKTDADKLGKLALKGDADAVSTAEAILDRYTLIKAVTNPDGYAFASAGGAERVLVEQGWRAFLIRVENPTGLSSKQNCLINYANFNKANEGTSAAVRELAEPLSAI